MCNLGVEWESIIGKTTRYKPTSRLSGNNLLSKKFLDSKNS